MEALRIFSNQLLLTCDEPSLLEKVVSFHVALHCNEESFHHYRELARVFEDLHSLTLEALHEDRETSIDLLAVKLLLDRLTPKPAKDANFWNLQYLRDTYIKHIKECQPTVDTILLSHYPEHNGVQQIR